MTPEKDNELCNRYPLIFADRYKTPKETLMCWGFECGDGWYHILDNLCFQIQSRIDQTNIERKRLSQYNVMIADAKQENWDSFDEYYRNVSDQNKESYKERTLSADFIKVPDPIPQVTVTQIKEKFGSLRFYYNGGDEYIRGLVAMAESISVTICEECGSIGERRNGSYVRTLCDYHAREQGYINDEVQ